MKNLSNADIRWFWLAVAIVATVIGAILCGRM